MKEEKHERKYITRSLLKSERHWTETLIKKFLGEPDKTVVNPMFKRSAPMKLYSFERVKRIERRKAFKDALAKSIVLQKAALERASKKRQEAIDYAKNVKIDIPIVKKNKIINAAIGQYNKHLKMYGHYDVDELAARDSSWDFLKRITLNYIRHNKTLYEYRLRKLFGKVGVQEAHDILKERVNEKILEAYPWLR